MRLQLLFNIKKFYSFIEMEFSFFDERNDIHLI